ncbi:ATPase [Maritalea sp.]|uniref:ATPase n=1 Tax=Maritalea sp. TaxID=2003361 RepID=UPI003EF263DE
MLFASAEEYRDSPRKAVTAFGMSGVGKTMVASQLRHCGWFHYSVDYRIGTRYMGEHIVDNFKQRAMQDPLLAELLRSDSIFIGSNITFHNLSPLSTYLGKPGDPNKGGIEFAEYKRRQAQHRVAEIAALEDTAYFIERAQHIYGYNHFIVDTSGSFCEVLNPNDANDSVLQAATANTALLYIRGTQEDEQRLISSFVKAPKPMYYSPDMLDSAWAEYKAEKHIANDNDVDPDDFAVWGFAALVRHRLPIYQSIADKHGYTVEARDFETIRDDKDFDAMMMMAVAHRLNG